MIPTITTTAYIQTDNFDLPKNGSSQKLFPFSLYITNKKDDTEVPSSLVDPFRFNPNFFTRKNIFIFCIHQLYDC